VCVCVFIDTHPREHTPTCTHNGATITITGNCYMCKYLQNAPSVDKPTPGIFTFAANERLLIVAAARNSFATTRSAPWAPKDKGAKKNFEKLTDYCLYL